MIRLVLKNVRPRNLSIALAFTIVFLFGFNMGSMLDFTNNMVMYFPLYVLISIPEIIIHGEEEGMKEIKFTQLRNKVKEFFVWLGTKLVVFAILISCIALLFLLIKDANFKQGIDYKMYLINVLSAAMLVGAIGLLTAVIFRNRGAVYVVGFLFWIYWNINYDRLSPLNPFLFIADPIECMKYIPLQWVYIVLLLLLTCWFNTKTPYFFKELSVRGLLRRFKKRNAL